MQDIDIEKHLSFVDIAELQDKISNFRDLNFRKMNYADVKKEVAKVISFKTSKGEQALLPTQISTYPKGTKFFRIRPIPSDDRSLPLKTMGTIADCWEAPADIVKAGRLNRENEPLLYTAPMNPEIAVEELKIADNELFSLIVYEATEDIKVTLIGVPHDNEGLSEESSLKMRMIQDFLKHEFIRDVGAGTEYLYRISESIVKDYFDLPPDVQDGWCYPSVAQKGTYNACFRPSIKVKIKLLGVQIAFVNRIDDSYQFGIKLIAKPSSNDVDLSYHQIGSLEQKELFPEIITESNP